MPVGILFFVMKINKEDVQIDVLGEAEAASAEKRQPRSPNTAYSNLYQLPYVSFGTVSTGTGKTNALQHIFTVFWLPRSFQKIVGPHSGSQQGLMSIPGHNKY